MTKRERNEQRHRELVAEYQRRAKEIALGSGPIIRALGWRERLVAEIAQARGRSPRTIRRALARYR